MWDIPNWINFRFQLWPRPAMASIYDQMSLNATPAYTMTYLIQACKYESCNRTKSPVNMRAVIVQNPYETDGEACRLD